MGILARVAGGSGRRTGRFLLAGGRLPAGAVLAGLVLTGTSAPASAQTLTWSVAPSPSPAITYNALADVSCTSATACTAVGNYGINSSVGSTLIESWNGTTWSVVPSPNTAPRSSSLSGVSCVSATACTAAGYYYTTSAQKTLIESWNGSSWSVVPSPNPRTAATSTACPAPRRPPAPPWAATPPPAAALTGS